MKASTKSVKGQKLNREVDFKIAQKNFRKLEKTIAPFVKSTKIVDISTEGQWQDETCQGLIINE